MRVDGFRILVLVPGDKSVIGELFIGFKREYVQKRSVGVSLGDQTNLGSSVVNVKI